MVHEAEGPRPVWIVPAPQVGLLLPLPRTAETQMVEKGTLLDCWMTVLAGNLSLNSRTDECRQWVDTCRSLVMRSFWVCSGDLE